MSLLTNQIQTLEKSAEDMDLLRSFMWVTGIVPELSKLGQEVLKVLVLNKVSEMQGSRTMGVSTTLYRVYVNKLTCSD